MQRVFLAGLIVLAFLVIAHPAPLGTPAPAYARVPTTTPYTPPPTLPTPTQPPTETPAYPAPYPAPATRARDRQPPTPTPRSSIERWLRSLGW